MLDAVPAGRLPSGQTSAGSVSDPARVRLARYVFGSLVQPPLPGYRWQFSCHFIAPIFHHEYAAPYHGGVCQRRMRFEVDIQQLAKRMMLAERAKMILRKAHLRRRD